MNEKIKLKIKKRDVGNFGRKVITEKAALEKVYQIRKISNGKKYYSGRISFPPVLISFKIKIFARN